MAESSNGSKSGEQCSKPVCIITLGMAGSGKNYICTGNGVVQLDKCISQCVFFC